MGEERSIQPSTLRPSAGGLPPAPPRRDAGLRLAIIVLITFAMLVVAITLAILTRTNVRGRLERSPDIGKASSSGPPVDTRELKGWFAFLAPTKAGQYDFDIYVFANGGTAVPVTTGPAADLAPDWSPDGSRIVFARNEDARLDTTEDFDLWTVDIDGGLLTRLTDTPTKEIEPRWSPDGSRIVYVSYPDLDAVPGTDARSSLVLRDLATGEERDLVAAEDPNYDPAWSPDGKQLAFVREPDDERPEIAVVDVDDGTVETLVTFGDAVFFPAWSPDGTTIAFVGRVDGNDDIYLLELASGRITRLTDDGATDSMPAWSPDGKHIVFIRDQEGQYDLWVMRADGSGQTSLLDGEVGMGAPLWITPPPAPRRARSWPQLRRRLKSRGYDSCGLVDREAARGDELSLYVCRREGVKRAAEVYVGASAAVRRKASSLETVDTSCVLYDRGQTWLAVTRYDDAELSRAIWDAHELGTHVRRCQEGAANL